MTDDMLDRPPQPVAAQPGEVSVNAGKKLT